MKVKSENKVAPLCPTFHDPMDYSLPGSSVQGVFQARVLEWGAIAFSIVSIINVCVFASMHSYTDTHTHNAEGHCAQPMKRSLGPRRDPPLRVTVESAHLCLSYKREHQL